MSKSIYTYCSCLKQHLKQEKKISQAWKFFGTKGLEDSSQCENMLDFNALTCKRDFDIIQNSCDLNYDFNCFMG
jgi:hypothetical protein